MVIPQGQERMFFRTIWVIDAIIGGVGLYFFVVGLHDGSVSSFNMTFWIGLLGGMGAVLWGSRALRAAGKNRSAVLTALIPAVPGLLMALFFLELIAGHPNWH